jgi:hypothetical protein
MMQGRVMNYSEEYIGLCQRLAELMEVVPEVYDGWYCVVMENEFSEIYSYDYAIGRDRGEIIVHFPPLSELVRWLREAVQVPRRLNRKYFSLLGDDGGWLVTADGVAEPAPTPEEAVLRALIAVLEKEANNEH